MAQVNPPEIDGAALVGFLEWFHRSYGAGATLLMILAVPSAIVGWQIYQSIRKDREANLAIAAKEQTIQHLAADNRLYRIQVFREQFKWTDQQIDNWLIKNEVPASLAPVPRGKTKAKK